MRTFSVILVTHNESRFLINWLDKMTEQFDGEIIVVDNCSTDNTAQILDRYKSIKVIYSPVNLGPFGGFIEGCKVAKSKLVACYSPDDEILPGYIQKMRMAITDYPFVDLYTCNTEVIREGIRYERILLPYTSYISPDYAVKMCQKGYNKNFNLCGLVVDKGLLIAMWNLGGKYMDINFDCLFTFFAIFEKGFVNVGEKLFVYHSYPSSWGASRNKDKVWKSIEMQLSLYRPFKDIYKRAIASGVCDKHRHFISNLALKTIMYLPKWIRKLLYNKIYDYKWEIEKL